MARVLAIDFGTKRIGLAVTDPLQIIANGLETVSNVGIYDFLAAYMAKEVVECIVIGDPRKMNYEHSESYVQLVPFIKSLERKYPEIPIRLIDERFTSSMASKAMIEGGVQMMKRRDKKMIDKISATLILQSYLEQKNNFKGEI